MWNKDRLKNISILLVMCSLLTVNYQFEKYYIKKENIEYETVDESWKLISYLEENAPGTIIYGDSDSLLYSSKLQFLTFDKTLYYLSEGSNLGDGEVLFSDVGDYFYDNLAIHVVAIDRDEYVYFSDDELYNLIYKWKNEK